MGELVTLRKQNKDQLSAYTSALKYDFTSVFEAVFELYVLSDFIT